MRLKISESKNAKSLYVIKSTYENGKHSTKIVEKLGTYADLLEKLNGQDPIKWAKDYIKQLNKQEKENERKIMVPYSPIKQIVKGEQQSFNGGYLFLQKIYYELGIHKICKEISDKYKFEFDLNSILSRLIYARILYPASKLATCELSKDFIEQPNFELQHVYRALEYIAKEMDTIQTTLYKNSMKISKRNTNVLYYDCTNFFFEIEQEEGLKQYGPSKEHKPNPIVQMGLFMDGDGVPLAFNINKGNTNEQLTMKPLEEQILSNFNLAKFIVCTDAGLASQDNRKFNNYANRGFITTQSIKKLKDYLKQWALDPSEWKLPNDIRTYHLSEIDKEKDKEKVFYKERWIKENGLEQRLLVTYSLKYKEYQRNIRDSQIERAQKAIDKHPTDITTKNPNDYKRFIHKTNFTSNGEVAENVALSLDETIITKEEAYDGFYAVCTNLENKALDIIKVNQRRWEIEECFRIMKYEFKSRPVNLQRDDRIKAHFTTCFMSLIVYRLLEKKLNNSFTCHEILKGLKKMNFKVVKGEGYTPTYTRTNLTDALHDAYGFRTDYEIVKTNIMKNIIKITKS
jgi:transposase